MDSKYSEDYIQGYKDGSLSVREEIEQKNKFVSCDDCEHFSKREDEEPCCSCKHSYTDRFRVRKIGMKDYWQRITDVANKQREKGVSEYGQTLEGNIFPSALERIDYITEELVDALMYLQWLRDSIGGD